MLHDILIGTTLGNILSYILAQELIGQGNRSKI